MGCDDIKKDFRRCVGNFPTGVTIVTAAGHGNRVGMTLNSFTSVSLDPLLVLVSLAHETRTLELIRGVGRFAVSVLAQGQENIARDFAVRGSTFPDTHVQDDGGFLFVREALAVIRCEVVNCVTAGDHDLLIAKVHSFDHSEGRPLVFHRGMFAALGEHIDAC